MVLKSSCHISSAYEFSCFTCLRWPGQRYTLQIGMFTSSALTPFSQDIHASCSLTLCNVNNNWHLSTDLQQNSAVLLIQVLSVILFWRFGFFICFFNLSLFLYIYLLLTYFDMWLTCHPDLNSVTGICVCCLYHSTNMERGNSGCTLPINWITISAVIKKKKKSTKQ